MIFGFREVRTIEVRADVQASGLTGGDSLGEPEQRCAKSAYPLLVKLGGSAHGRTDSRDLDRVAVPTDTHFGEGLVEGVALIEHRLAIGAVTG